MSYAVEFDYVQKTGKAFAIAAHVVNVLDPTSSFPADNAVFIQTEQYVKAGIAVQPYGVISYDGTARGSDSPDALLLPDLLIDGAVYKPDGKKPIMLIGLTDGLYEPADSVVPGSLFIQLAKETDEGSGGEENQPN